MASRAEQLKRLKQGEEAKQRVLSGASRQASTSIINPRTEALRNYVPPAVQEFKAPNTSDFLSTVGINPTQFAKTEVSARPMTVNKPVIQPPTGIKTPLQTKLFGALGDQQSLAEYKANTGFDFARDNRSQYEKEQANIDNSKMPGVVKSIASAGNLATRGNPVGRFLSQATTVPGVSIGTNDSTGNKIVDKAGKLIGDYISPLLVPTGAPLGSGTMAAPYEAAGKLLNTGLGQKVTNALGTGISKVPLISSGVGQKLAKAGLTEGIAGTIQNPAQMLVNDSGRSGKELATDAAIGGITGFGLGMAGEGIGMGISKGIGKLTGKNKIPESAVADAITPNKSTPITPEPTPKTRTQAIQEYNAKVESAPTVEPVQSSNPYSTATEDIPEFLKTNRNKIPDPIPVEEPILRPNQFNESGQDLGISAFGKTKAYDSLSNDTRSQLVSRIDKEKKTLEGVTDKLYTSLVDDLHPLNKLDKLVDKVLGTELKGTDRAHTVALGTRGADVVSKQIITDAMVNSEGKAVGKSLKEVLADLPKKKDIYVDFEDYLLNKHAITRAGRDEKVFRDSLQWTPEKGAKKIQEFEELFPEFKTMSDDLYNFNKDMVNNWLVDTGMITKEQAAAWFEANPFYVPNKRHFSEMEKSSGGVVKAKNGFGNQSVPVKKYGTGGSQRKIISPIESTIENVDAYVKAAKRNQVMQKVVENIQKAPDAFKDFAEIVEQPKKLDDITKMITDGDSIDDILNRFSEDFDSVMQRTKLDSDNIVRVLIGGEPVHVRINDRQLLDAITALGPDNSNALLNAVGKLTNTMKVLTTGNNPIFTFTRSLFRDIPQAYIASKSTNNPITFAMDLASAAIDMGFSRGAYKEFLNSGGGHSSSVASNRDLLGQSKRAVLPNKGRVVQNTLKRGYNAYENLMNMVESGPRLAEFKRTGKKTGDIQQALFEAQDVTTNFKRRGTLTKDLDKVFPYFNAAMQGLDQVMRVYKDNPTQAITKSVLALTIPAMALYAVNHDNEDYKQLSNRVKDAFFLVPKGDGTFIKIAKPQEQGSIFTDVPERLMRVFQEKDPEGFADFADRLRTTFLPPILSGAAKKGGITDRLLGVFGDTIVGPVADIAANKNFSDTPIVPGNLSRLSPGLQSDAKTSSVAKWIGEKTNTSPKQLDYLGRQYSGFVGQFAQPLLSPGGDVGSTLNQQVTADPVFSNDIATKFYKYKDKLDQAYADRSQKDLPDWYHDGLRKQLGKISDNMADVRAVMRDVQADKSLGNAEKRKQLRDLQQEINEMGKAGNEYAKELID